MERPTFYKLLSSCYASGKRPFPLLKSLSLSRLSCSRPIYPHARACPTCSRSCMRAKSEETARRKKGAFFQPPAVVGLRRRVPLPVQLCAALPSYPSFSSFRHFPPEILMRAKGIPPSRRVARASASRARTFGRGLCVEKRPPRERGKAIWTKEDFPLCVCVCVCVWPSQTQRRMKR